jgi:hypothetical protein
MIFGNLCARRDTVNLFCNASGNCGTWSAASVRVELNTGNPARGRQRADPRRMSCEPSEVRAVGELSPSIRTAGFRRRGRGPCFANLFLIWSFLVRTRVPAVHTPWKILIPHSTTTMANTSVATANTLSKEATLILLSASSPASGLVDSLILPQSRGHNRLNDTVVLWFAGHTFFAILGCEPSSSTHPQRVPRLAPRRYPPAPCRILLLLNARNQQAPLGSRKTCVFSTPCCACAISIPR